MIAWGLVWRGATRAAGFWTLVVGAPVGFVAFLTGEVMELYDLQYLYGTGIMFVASIVLFLAISAATPAPSREELEGLTWSRQTWRDESAALVDTPWYLNYRVLGLGLVVLTLALVAPLL